MIGIKGEYRLKTGTGSDRDALVLYRNPGRRIFYGVIFVILAAAFLIGAGSVGNIFQAPVLGILIYSAMSLGSLYTAGYNKSFVFHTDPTLLKIRHAFFGVDLPVKKEQIENLTAVTVDELHLLKNTGTARTNIGRRMDQLAKSRSMLFKIYCESDQKRVFLFETSDQNEAVSIAEGIGSVLNLPVKTEVN